MSAEEAMAWGIIDGIFESRAALEASRKNT